ncbi:hypothetical protein [Acidovorax sp. BLS4]|uniref:hypothetical protein n=1 Tax=Acidovorax sp. BLS4 TaxID=3273430 RepID=UPI00294333E9|nr:hypothetical protein [Paracidovorax avenae]WOI47007.1 hypothetical protein R1Z03_07280 [Paracidovorax avenae]
MTQPYTPRKDSVPGQVVRFLGANPTEKLDAGTISEKYGCSRSNVHTLMASAVQAGLVIRFEDLDSGELAYCKGSGKPLVESKQTAQSAFHGWLARKGETSAEGGAARRAEAIAPPPEPTAPTPQRRKPAPRFTMDARTVPIEKVVPLPSGVKVMDWSPLLDKLEPGDSFLVPYAARSSISTAVKAYKDATGKTLTTRTLEAGIRVWRTK